LGKRLFPQTLGAPGVALEKMGTINKLSEETNKFEIDKNLGGDSKTYRRISPKNKNCNRN